MPKEVKIIIAILVIAAVASILGVAGFFLYHIASGNVTTGDKEPRQQESVVVGGDRDEHGCIGSAGYSWCEPKNKCLRIWEEVCYASAEQEIQYTLAKKYNKSVSEVTIKVSKKTDEFMAGSVSFAAAGLLAPGESGGFLAAKAGNMWELLYDGNGSVDCDSIKRNYQFPKDVLAGYCD